MKRIKFTATIMECEAREGGRSKIPYMRCTLSTGHHIALGRVDASYLAHLLFDMGCRDVDGGLVSIIDTVCNLKIPLPFTWGLKTDGRHVFSDARLDVVELERWRSLLAKSREVQEVQDSQG